VLFYRLHLRLPSLHTYVRTYIHTYIRTYTHTHTYIIHTYIYIPLFLKCVIKAGYKYTYTNLQCKILQQFYNPTLSVFKYFFVLLTGHPGMILVNNQLDAQFFMYVYFYSLHVSGSHVHIIRRIIVSMRHLVCVTRRSST